MDRKEASFILANIDRRVCDDELNEALDMAIKALDQEPCEMTVEEYRQRMIQAFHNADTDELIAICVLPTEKEFEHLEWLLKNHYKKESCDDAIDRAEAIKIASGYCHPANVAKELAKLPPVNPTKTGWIPVSERLPDKFDRYLISTDEGRVEMVGYGYTDDLPNEIAFHEWDDEEWQCWKPNVTAWMPKPKAYKAESEAET